MTFLNVLYEMYDKLITIALPYMLPFLGFTIPFMAVKVIKMPFEGVNYD